ncbi:hypothetical protein D3C71_1363900 [compost metagenome]
MLGFAFRQSVCGHLDTVVATVAHQVSQRIGDLFHQPLVQFGGFAQRHQFHLLAQLIGQIPEHAGETAEDNGHRNHADRHDRLLKIAGIAIQVSQPCQQLLVRTSIQAPAVLRQHRLGDHQFAHQIDELVDLFHIDPNGRGLHLRLHGNLRLAGLGGCSNLHSLGWGLRCVRCIRTWGTRRFAEETVGLTPSGASSKDRFFILVSGNARRWRRSVTDQHLFLGHMKGKQVEQIVVGGGGFHRETPRIGLWTFYVTDRPEARDIPKKLLDGIRLLQSIQGTNLNLQGPRLSGHRRYHYLRCRRWCCSMWSWSWSRCGRRRGRSDSRGIPGDQPCSKFTNATHQ